MREVTVTAALARLARTVSMGGPRDAQARARVSVRLASAAGGSCTAAASRYSRRRVHRRACMQLLRDQRTEISLSASAASSHTTEVILSREQRAHSRLSWAERGVQEAILPTKACAMRRRRLDGSQETYLIAMVCGTPPVGLARWTLRLLAQQLVELGYVETISHETVRQVLLTNELKSWIKKQWCIPTAPDGEFVYHMGDILHVYTRPYDPARSTFGTGGL